MILQHFFTIAFFNHRYSFVEVLELHCYMFNILTTAESRNALTLYPNNRSKKVLALFLYSMRLKIALSLDRKALLL
jgi:hypothetical protein